MNLLKLDKVNRIYYEALVDLNSTDTSDPEWIDKYRRVKRIKQLEGKRLLPAALAFNQYNNKLPEVLVRMSYRR